VEASDDEDAMTTTQPGWYPDPQNPATMRWFDGTQWTAHVATAATLDPRTVQRSSWSTTKIVVTVVAVVVGVLVVLGVLAAIAIPVFLNQANTEGFRTSVEGATCEQVVAEAVELSHRDLPDGYVALASVTDAHAVTDDRGTVQRPATGELAHVLTCEGTGQWEDGSSSAIRLSLSVDSAGRHTIADTTDTSPTT